MGTHRPPALSARLERRDGNGVDVCYLLETREALVPIMAATHVAARQAVSRHVRALARLAQAEHVEQLAVTTACLRAWGHDDLAQSAAAVAQELSQLGGVDLDLAFVDLLGRHAEASLARARIEMVGGASRVARPIAEMSIHEQDRRLAALDLLSRATGPGSAAPAIGG